MSTNKTPNLELHRWEPLDPFTRAEFNDNFTKLDTTWADLNAANTKLDTSLSKFTTSFTTSLAGKVGRSQIIQIMKSDGSTTGTSFGYTAPIKTWSDWEYVCFVVQYPGMTTQTTPLSFSIFGPGAKEVEIVPLALPGYLVVFLPRHDGTQPAAGFVIANRFVPFSCPYSFDSILQLDFSTQNLAYTLVKPNVVALAGA